MCVSPVPRVVSTVLSYRFYNRPIKSLSLSVTLWMVRHCEQVGHAESHPYVLEQLGRNLRRTLE